MPNASKAVEKGSARYKDEKNTTPSCLFNTHPIQIHTHAHIHMSRQVHTHYKPPDHLLPHGALPLPALLGTERHRSIPRMPLCQWAQLGRRVVSPWNGCHLFQPSEKEWMDSVFHASLKDCWLFSFLWTWIYLVPFNLFKRSHIFITESTYECRSIKKKLCSTVPIVAVFQLDRVKC